MSPRAAYPRGAGISWSSSRILLASIFDAPTDRRTRSPLTLTFTCQDRPRLRICPLTATLLSPLVPISPSRVGWTDGKIRGKKPSKVNVLPGWRNW